MATSPPVVDQVQFGPFAYREGLARAFRERLSRARGRQRARRLRPHVGPTVGAIAQRLDRPPAPVLLRWGRPGRRARGEIFHTTDVFADIDVADERI